MMKGWELDIRSDEIERTSSWKSHREKVKRWREELRGTKSLSPKKEKQRVYNKEKKSLKRESFNLRVEFSSDSLLSPYPLSTGIPMCMRSRGAARVALIEHPVETISCRSDLRIFSTLAFAKQRYDFLPYYYMILLSDLQDIH